MARPRFSIGIDLGTTNCAMAFEAFDTAAPQSELFLIPQWETLAAFSEASTLPSFLYLLSEDETQQMPGESTQRAAWIPGRLARKRAAESPGRVVHSAKSWLCHHSVDRNAPFLPWRSDEIPVEKRISPIRASALLLEHLRAVWNAKFAAEGLQFEEQDVTITVPASFDAVAQRLTLDAARAAGFPEDVRLLRNPRPHSTVGWNTAIHRATFGDSALTVAPITSWLLTSAAAQPISHFLRSPPNPERRFRTSSESPSATTCFSEATISTSRLRITSNRGWRWPPVHNGTFLSRSAATLRSA